MTSNREERVVREKDNRDKARDAMRSLLRTARAKVESGVSGDLPLDEIQDAKEFFLQWRKRKPFEHNRLLFFGGTILTFFLFHPHGLEETIMMIAGISVLWFLYVVLEFDKRKRVYISEMLGNLSHLPWKDVNFYTDGLLHDLWRIEKEGIRISLLISSFLLIAIDILWMGLSDGNPKTRGAAIAVGMMISVIFFSQNIIFVKKISTHNAE